MKKFIIFLLLVFPIIARSQSTVKESGDPKYIEVEGRSEQNVVPDQIFIRILLRERDLKGNITMNEVEKQMKEKLKSIGIAIDKDLSIQDFVSSYKSTLLNKSVQLTKDYQLLVHDTKTMQRVYMELQSLDISNVNIVRVDNSNLANIRNQLKIDAIKNAKEKAEMLAKAINQTIGNAIYIQESKDNSYDNNILSSEYSLREVVVIRKSNNSDNDDSIEESEFKAIKLVSKIIVRFEL